MDYYTIPIKLDHLLDNRKKDKPLEKADIRLSIHQNIRLILKTLSLSYRFDPTFGSILHKYHARTPPQRRSERAWREEMREGIQKNLKDLLQRYETRIQVTDVVIDLNEPRKGDAHPEVKVKVEIDGRLRLGRREKFHFPDSEIEEDAQEVFPLVIPVGKR